MSLLVFVSPAPAPGVWLMYAQFAVQKMDKFEEGVAFPREVFERAITASGLHVSKVRGSPTMTWDFSATVTVAGVSFNSTIQKMSGCPPLVAGVVAVGCLSRV